MDTETKQSDAGVGVGCFILVLACLGGTVPVVALEVFAPGFLSEKDVITFIFRLTTLILLFVCWIYALKVIFEGVYGAYRALRGERLKVACYQPSPNQFTLRLPEPFVLSLDKTVELRRGDPLPPGMTKASKSLIWGVLNVLAVDHVVIGSNLHVEFKGAMSEASKHMVCICLADAIWCELGKPVTFVCKGLPARTDVGTELT